ncbi:MULTISPECIES: hypothetical protein [unclassified Streptomyces]|uniref:hypothetical protein n=1 Tax=unclassified Streptomyces TaxID=2593676 RepID=UPI0033B57431
MGNIKTYVCADDMHIYPATVDLSHRWNGWLSPGFTLDVVRQMALDTQEIAEADGFTCNDQIILIEGPEAVVLHVRWAYHKEDGAAAVGVIKPDEDGLYWIGGWEWTWYQVEDGPLFHTANATWDAWKRFLDASGRRIGEVLRAQMPGATSCVIDLTQLGHIVEVEAEGGVTWPSGTEEDGPDGYGPFDGETLGAADELVRQALDHGRDPVSLELAHWRPIRHSPFPLHRIHFPPADLPPMGEQMLAEARTAFAEARVTWLKESAPYLVRDVHTACPEAVGVIVDPTAEDPFVTLLTDHDCIDTESVPVPADLAEKVTKRLGQMFHYRPTGAELTAAGWSSDVPASLNGAYWLSFPKA